MAQMMGSSAVSQIIVTMTMVILFMHDSRRVTVVMAGLDIGVCYGMQAGNLPPAKEVISLYKQYGITKLRLFEPNHDALEALRGSDIQVSLGVRNEDIPNMASSIDAATSWFDTNVQPYLNDVKFTYFTVGNDVSIPGDFDFTLVHAIGNLVAVLINRNLSTYVTTVVAGSVLGVSNPPSAGDFTLEAKGVMNDLVTYLSITGTPLMVNAYPYFAFASGNISLDYAQFTAPGPVVIDGELKYQNMLDAIVDAYSSAIEKQGISMDSVGITVAESGWPSAGNGNFTTPELASTYNKNFVKHILSRVGTPMRPKAYVDAFLFSMFNEDKKPGGIDQNWGLFYPNKQPVYSVFK